MVFIFAVLFFALIVASIAVGVMFWRAGKKSGSKNKVGMCVSGVLAAVMFVLFIFIPFGFVEIDTGEIAVVKVFGRAEETKTSGLHFRNILTTRYDIYDIKTQQMDIVNEVYTKDAQPLFIELTVHYSIMADKAIEISTTYGQMEILSQRIEKIAIEKSKVVLSAKTAMELMETRAAISPDVLNEIKTIEGQYFIKIENVVVVDMAFSDAFEKAVEEKMIAQQEVVKAEAEKEKAVIKAQQDLAVAKLAAEEALAKAEGEAEAQIASARAEAEALKLKSIEVARMLGFKIKETPITEEIEVLNDQNETVTQTVTKIIYEIDFEDPDSPESKLISEYLRYIAYLEAWNGELPTVILDDNASIILPTP